jgi:hypothetical protein
LNKKINPCKKTSVLQSILEKSIMLSLIYYYNYSYQANFKKEEDDYRLETSFVFVVLVNGVVNLRI